MDIFHALAEPTRRHIVEMLAAQDELTATDIAGHFPVSSSAISQHLKVLREARLVRMRKQAQQRIYQINPVAFAELADWTQKVSALWNQRFDALDALLKADKDKLTK